MALTKAHRFLTPDSLLRHIYLGEGEEKEVSLVGLFVINQLKLMVMNPKPSFMKMLKHSNCKMAIRRRHRRAVK